MAKSKVLNTAVSDDIHVCAKTLNGQKSCIFCLSAHGKSDLYQIAIGSKQGRNYVYLKLKRSKEHRRALACNRKPSKRQVYESMRATLTKCQCFSAIQKTASLTNIQ
jgi:hypothetical protein